MNLSVSNIAWASQYDEDMYEYLNKMGFNGLEIAPTRIFPQNPYNDLSQAKAFSRILKENYGLVISSMQSIWYGISQSIFGSDADRELLIKYTKKAIEFAHAVGCKNLVFGCPKNRVIQNENQYETAVGFFKNIADYAKVNGTVVAIEPNPVIYNTNFINYTNQAFDLARLVGSDGFKVNVDFGTIIYNNEILENIVDNMDLVNHIHISEPNLALIRKRGLHKEFVQLIKPKYNKFVSVEMGKRDDIQEVKNTIIYIKEVFA